MPKGIYKRTKKMKTGKHMLGRKLSLETRKKMRNSSWHNHIKGCIPWNKGKSKLNDLRISKYAGKLMSRKLSKKHRKKLAKSHKGNKLSNKTKKKLSKVRKQEWEIGVRKGGWRHSKESKLKISNASRGEKGNNWRGGITPENNIIRHSIEMRLWRESVFARDNWTCQKCGKQGNYLHPHHIKNFAEYPELRFAIDNGITFCKNCHEKFHKIYGRKNNNKGQVIEYLKNKIIYVYLCGDVIHIGHLIHLRRAREQNGIVVVGVLTDSAVSEKKSRPAIPYKERFQIVAALKDVDFVIKQDTYSPLPNVKRIKPDILMESDSHDLKDIKNVMEFVKSYGGKVVVNPYYKPQSSTLIKDKIIYERSKT